MQTRQPQTSFWKTADDYTLAMSFLPPVDESAFLDVQDVADVVDDVPALDEATVIIVNP